MRENAKILICEGNEDYGILLKEYLESKNLSADLFCNGITGNYAVPEKNYTLCIIDILLPGTDGFTLAEEIKKYQPEMLVILLADKVLDVKSEVLTALKMGADDFFIKPYDFDILSYRIEAILNRVFKKEKPEPERYNIGDFTYNQYDHSLSDSSSKIKLTTKESDLLKLLCIHMNEILPREEALMEIWGKADYFTARSMDVYITKLRKRFKGYPGIQIINIRGKGYKLINNELAS